MTDLYELLGVSRDATPEDIRKAYKSAAQKAHPDKNDGDTVPFVRISNAYGVLSNRVHREQYNATGKVRFSDSVESQAHDLLAQVFSQIIDDGDFDHDLGPYLSRHVLAIKNKMMAEADELDKTITVLESQKGRVASRGETNIFESIINNRIKSIKGYEETLKGRIQILDYALRMLDDYVDLDPRHECKQPQFTNFSVLARTTT